MHERTTFSKQEQCIAELPMIKHIFPANFQAPKLPDGYQDAPLTRFGEDTDQSSLLRLTQRGMESKTRDKFCTFQPI